MGGRGEHRAHQGRGLAVGGGGDPEESLIALLLGVLVNQANLRLKGTTPVLAEQIPAAALAQEAPHVGDRKEGYVDAPPDVRLLDELLNEGQLCPHCGQFLPVESCENGQAQGVAGLV